jgi:hypothetical protein
MDPVEQLNHIRELGKARAKRHYDANKEAVNAKRRAKYAEKKATVATTQALAPAHAPAVPKAPSKQYTWDDIIGPQQPKKTELTLEEVSKKIKDLDLHKGTEKKYLEDIQRTMKMTGCTDLLVCLTRPQQIIKLVNESKKKNGEPYSDNTKKSVFQSILFVIDNLKLSIDKKPYNEQFELYKIKSADLNEQKIQNEEVPSWKEYLKKSRAKFGMTSKEYLLARFYDELTVRDDFGLIITDEILDNNNYLLVRGAYIEIVINTYKTDKKYGQIRYKLKKSLENLTREYIAKNKLKIGDLIFGTPKLTSVISKMNDELGYHGGVNFFRHMTVTEELEKASPAQRLKLAEVMKHSPVVQKAYLRKKKLI